MTSPDRASSPVARTAGLSAEHRAALIAHLSARLAAVPSAPTVTQRGTGSRPTSGASASSAVAPGGGQDRSRGTRPQNTAVGSSGTEGRTGRRRPDGGHPEDAPGDPETVAKQICLRRLASASQPRATLADVLQRRGIPDDVAASVLDRFTEVGLIDDEAYAAAYVSTKQRDRSLGARALRTELRRKGLDDQVITGAVADIDEDDERERAAALVARRIDAAMAAGPVAARRRLVGLLARRGYSAGLAHAVVSEALGAYDGGSVLDDDHDGLGGGPGAPGSDPLDAADDVVEADDDPGTDDPDGVIDRRGPVRSRWPRRSLRSG